MKVFSLASGSKGNAYCVESQGALLLIDCGLSCRELIHRLGSAGYDAESIAAVVFTHDHSDHIAGVESFHRRYPMVELNATMITAEAIAQRSGLTIEDFYTFEIGQEFATGPFLLESFGVPHDAADPVGYIVRADGCTYFHGTDIGTPLESIGRQLSRADVAVLESNHDPVMVCNSPRPESTKRRILGARGHLANDECAQLVRRFASQKLKHLFLAHLSQQCNTPELAEKAARSALAEIGRSDVALEILLQDKPSSVFCGVMQPQIV